MRKNTDMQTIHRKSSLMFITEKKQIATVVFRGRVHRSSVSVQKAVHMNGILIIVDCSPISNYLTLPLRS